MGTAALAAQVALAAVFAVAGAGKLLDLPGSRRALTGFGVPERTAAVGGTLLPIVELLVAAVLVVQPTARWGALAALVLLVTFIAGIANAMSRGERPDCGCFGALHSAQAGWQALLRNVALALLAGFVVVRGEGPPLDDWVADRGAAELTAVTAGIAAVLLGAAAARTWWQNRGLRRDLAAAQQDLAAVPPGLPVGALAPAFAVPAPDGSTVTLDSLLARGLPVFLLFSRAGCGPSEALMPTFESWRDTLADRLTFGFVGAGSSARYRRSGAPSLTEARDADPLLVEEMTALYEVFAAYRVKATPSAVVLSPDGTVRSATVDGRPAIEALLRQTLGGTPASVPQPSAA